MPSPVGLFSSISFLQYPLTSHLLHLNFPSYHICWGSHCNLSTSSRLCTLSSPSIAQISHQYLITPLYMLYTTICCHVFKKHHIRINADMLAGFYWTQWKKTELPLLCCGGRSLSPLASCWLFNRTSRSLLSARQPPAPHCIFLKVSRTISKQKAQSHKSLFLWKHPKKKEYNVTEIFGNTLIKNTF